MQTRWPGALHRGLPIDELQAGGERRVDRVGLTAANNRHTGPGAMTRPQTEQRRSTAQMYVRAVPVAPNRGSPASQGVIASTG